MSFCSIFSPARIGEQTMFQLIEIFLVEKLATILGKDPIKYVNFLYHFYLKDYDFCFLTHLNI